MASSPSSTRRGSRFPVEDANPGGRGGRAARGGAGAAIADTRKREATIENIEIANALDDVADLLEIEGENRFRVIAYRNGARVVRSFTRPVTAMIAAGEDLTAHKGIGKDLSAHITELAETGGLTLLDELAVRVPRSLVDLVKLDGVGPKKAKALFEERGIESVDALEAALDTGRIEELEGFGAKTVEKIRRSIRDFRKHQERILLSEADELVASLVEHMRSCDAAVRIEAAGSWRRRRETVGDIDLLVQADEDPKRVVEHFVAHPGVVETKGAGETRAAIVLRSGVSVDLRVIPKRSFGAALQYFTGSKEHGVAIRTRAVKQGLRVNEWGVFEVPEGVDPDELGKEEGKRVGGVTEEEVYRAVGLPWIPPEIREDRGEIETAVRGGLPDLVEEDEIRGDLQMHSTWSDGKNSIREMAEACAARGYAYMSLTDHSKAVAVARGLDAERVREQWEEIAEVREQVEGIRIFRSLEIDILKDGSLDMEDEILEGLDVVLVSVHSWMNLPGPEMTDRVIRAIEHPRVDILAHPTGRLLNRREPFEMDVEAVLEAAAELDVAVELNANPNRLDLNDLYVRRAKELGVKVSIATDAHSVEGLANMRYGVGQARRGWLEKGDILNCMALRAFERWLERERPGR